MDIDYSLLAQFAGECEYDYKVRDFFCEMAAEHLRKELGVYIYYERGMFTCESLRFQKNAGKYGSYGELHDELSALVAGGGEDVFLRNSYKYAMDGFRIGDKPGELHQAGYGRGLRNLDDLSLFELLRHAVTGEIEKDRGIEVGWESSSQKFSDENKERNDTFYYPRGGCLQYQCRVGEWIDMSTVSSELSGLRLKAFLNGKILIKGLTDEQWGRLVHLNEVCRK